MMPHRIEDFGGDAVGLFQDVVARGRMRLDQGALLGIEAARLVEYIERDLCLAHVVKHRRRIQPLDIGFGNAEAQAEIDRNSGHQKAVLVGPFVVAANRFQPVGQSMFLDRRGNFRAGVPGGCDIDRCAARYRREHGRQRDLAGRRGRCRALFFRKFAGHQIGDFLQQSGLMERAGQHDCGTQRIGL